MSLKEKNLPRDASSAPIQTGNSFVCVDANSVPLSSPLTLSAGVNTITVPETAIEFIVNPISADLQVSNESTMTSYDVVKNTTKESIPCAGSDFIYIQGSVGNVVNFRFTVL